MKANGQANSRYHNASRSVRFSHNKKKSLVLPPLFLPLSSTLPSPPLPQHLQPTFAMAASPDQPSTPPPRGSTDHTSTTPGRVVEAKETKSIHDLTMSSDDELFQGSPKKVKLSHPRPGKDAEKILTPFLPETGASIEAGVPTTDCAPSDSNTPIVPADIEAECLVVTPPATSPTLGACEDVPITISEGFLAATPEPTSPVPDAAPQNDNRPSRCSTPSDHWCADDYGVFDPDERENFAFASYDGDIFTDPSAFKEHIMYWAMMENDRKFRRHLQDCLRGSARTWYESLNEEEREDLRESTLEDWLDLLIANFSADYDDVMKIIKAAPWDWSKVQKKVKPEDWLEYLYGCATQVSEYQWEALHIAWGQIDPEMRDDVPEPDSDIEYQDFLDYLEQANEEWRETLRLKNQKEQKEQKGNNGSKGKKGIRRTKRTKAKTGKR